MLLKILRESFSFLIKNPLFFVPRFFSVIIWNILFLNLVEGLHNFAQNQNIFHLMQLEMEILPYFLVFTFISLAIHSMYPSMVRDFKKKGNFSLLSSLIHALKRFPQIFVVFLIPTVLFILVSLPLLLFLVYGILKSNLTIIVFGSILITLLLIASVVLFYFSPSRVVLTRESGWKSLISGLRLSRKFFREATLMTLFSLFMLFLAFSIESTFKEIGLIGFWIGRILGAVFGTYLFILNADLYLEVER